MRPMRQAPCDLMIGRGLLVRPFLGDGNHRDVIGGKKTCSQLAVLSHKVSKRHALDFALRHAIPYGVQRAQLCWLYTRRNQRNIFHSSLIVRSREIQAYHESLDGEDTGSTTGRTKGWPGIHSLPRKCSIYRSDIINL